MAVDKLVDSAQLDGYFTNIASAIRSKAGVSSTYTPSEMPQAIQDIPSGGGGDEDVKEIIERTVTMYSWSGSYIGSYAFAGCSYLSSVYLPNATRVYKGAFSACERLTNISMPEATLIDSYGFGSCTGLINIMCDSVKTIGSNAFTGCTNLETASFPAASYISTYAFRSNTKLSKLYLLGSSVAYLAASAAFSGTPLASGSGSIYVPASLYTVYKSSIYWSYYSNRFVSV